MGAEALKFTTYCIRELAYAPKMGRREIYCRLRAC